MKPSEIIKKRALEIREEKIKGGEELTFIGVGDIEAILEFLDEKFK